MNINKNFIIIFGTLVLSIIIIFGTITYYNQRAEQAQIPNGEQSVLNSFQDYPAGPKRLLDFIDYCTDAVLFSDVEELKDKEIKEVVCIMERELRKLVLEGKTLLVSVYNPSFLPLDSIISFSPDRYISISVDMKDAIKKYDPSLLEKDRLSFCSISEPAWEDKLYLQIVPEQNLFFPEGNIGCAQLAIDKIHSMTFSGFIPQAESLNIKTYLVDGQIVSDVMNRQLFSEIKEILNNYPIIWQTEKPIILSIH